MSEAAIQLPFNWMLFLVLNFVSSWGIRIHTEMLSFPRTSLKVPQYNCSFTCYFMPHIQCCSLDPYRLSWFSQHTVLWLAEASTKTNVNSVGTMKWPEFGQRCFECYLLFYLFIGWLSLIRFLCIYLFISQSSICIFYFWRHSRNFVINQGPHENVCFCKVGAVNRLVLEL